ncbi:MAG: zinc ribbon domain-containing protein, partial [Ruminococcus sp.]|nr:zinc ribbon domain-containing protein [Ruminococcus sp.]
MNCQNCGQQIAASSKFCRYCGAAVEAPKPKRLCPTCGAELNEDALSCWRCETSFDTEQAAPNFNADFNAGAPRIHPAQGSRVDLGEYYEGAETAEGAPAPSADAAEGTTYAGYSATPVAPEPVPAAPAAAPEAAPVKKSKAPMIAAISTAAVVALGVGAFFGVRSLAGSKDSDSSTAQAAHAAEGGTTTAAPVEDSTPAETTAATEAQTEKKTRKTTTTTKAATTTTTTAAPAPEYEGRKYDPKAKKTVIVVDDPDTGAWSNCFGGDWIDYHTLPRDTDLHFTVEVKLSDTFIGMMEADILNGDEQIGLAPTSMDAVTGWKHLGEEVNYVDGDFPIGNKLKALDGYNDGTYMVKAK